MSVRKVQDRKSLKLRDNWGRPSENLANIYSIYIDYIITITPNTDSFMRLRVAKQPTSDDIERFVQIINGMVAYQRTRHGGTEKGRDIRRFCMVQNIKTFQISFRSRVFNPPFCLEFHCNIEFRGCTHASEQQREMDYLSQSV